MEKFTILTAVAAPLNMRNVDTDMIIPKQYLKTIKRTGLGRHLFDEMRYDENGKERPAFILNKLPYRQAEILIAGENFGCGSSREHAPWALLDFGIRCVIAPSFADIFYNNCFKNGILPITLPQDEIDRLMSETQMLSDAGAGAPTNQMMTVDLTKQQMITPTGRILAFELDPFRRHCLLEGLDDIGLTLQKTDRIQAYERDMSARHPWL